ncbi:alpha/beta fold hydrolase [Actinoallomurus acaciae]|uniref:Alpha/beta fold hydrolase n=1 Tax=Actinoallomurus acaciae TaxID=502577 RepID=A0ABV5YPY0_9ACTN
MGAQADLRRGLGFMRPLGRVGPSVIEPDLPPTRVIDLPGRGRVTARVVDGDAPVLLLHGWTLTADVNFCHLMPRLPGGLVAMDHHGHGRGPTRAQRFTIEGAADDQIALLDALGIDKVIVLGYSLGGPVGLDLALRYPERVAGLILQATAMRFDSWMDRLTKPLLRAVRPLTALGLGRTAPLRFFGDTRNRSTETKLLWQWLRRELMLCHPRTMVDVMLAEYDFDFRPHAASLKDVPTVVMVTAKDSAVPPRDQRAMAEGLGAEVITIEEDHDVFLAAPTTYVAASLEAIARVTT